MLKIGIVGLPNVGKSTLFNALTKQSVDCANYPFCTIEPNIGIVPVPDERLEKLAEMSHSEKTIPAVVEFVDIAGLVKGAAEGEGLGNAFLSHIREVDAIAEVVRVFEDKKIVHIADAVNPISDIDVLEYELILKDLETVTKKIESIQRDVKAGKHDAKETLKILQETEKNLASGKLISSLFSPLSNVPTITRSRDSWNILEELNLLTTKPIIYVFNASEEQIQNKWAPSPDICARIGSAPSVIISAKIEADLASLTNEEQKEYLASFNIHARGLDMLIQTAYQTLGLIPFFTTGEKETRGWTILTGSKASRAGRAIHSDFEEKFIRAEVIHWEKLIEAGSWARARETGLLRAEGKEYVVKDGDVMEFKI